MKFSGILVLLTICFFRGESQNPYESEKQVQEVFFPLRFGDIKPRGWIEKQMQGDLNGFVGNLNKLVPTLIDDDIYFTNRLSNKSKAKDLGVLKEGNLEGEEQYMWWNSETQSNWWDGYLRNVVLLNDSVRLLEVKKYIDHILASQDSDGYLGIYQKDLRYNFKSENGELWSKATLYRSLLGYYEATGEIRVWNALAKAVDNVMINYPMDHSNPFYAGTGFSGGVAHGLVFTDVLERMYQLSALPKYRDYTLFLYRNFSENITSEKDVQYLSIMDKTYRLQSHAVHTYEHLRSLIVAYHATGNQLLSEALNTYLERISACITPSGAPIGDEWILKRHADATMTGYEYCSIHELMDSYSMLFQKQGSSKWGDEIEKLFYNAAQGARHPDQSCIAYLKTDNSYQMTGTRNGFVEPDRNQTRYKYSPAHQDVAVCCNPNAGRITPYFVKSMFLVQPASLVASLLGPSELNFQLQGNPIKVIEQTEYPYQNKLRFVFTLQDPMTFQFKVRKPAWTKGVKSSERYREEHGYLIFDRKFNKTDAIDIEFIAAPVVHTLTSGEKYFSYGALIYASPITSTEKVGKEYEAGFNDLTYQAVTPELMTFLPNQPLTVSLKGKYPVLQTFLKSSNSGEIKSVELIPVGKTILRQVTFKP